MIKLIPEWKKAWKFASVQLPVIGLVLMTVVDVLQQTWVNLPPAVQNNIPHSTTIAIVMLVLSPLGRLFVFIGNKANEPDPQE